MQEGRHWWLAPAMALALTGCSGEVVHGVTVDGGGDAAVEDAGVTQGGATASGGDAGASPDASGGETVPEGRSLSTDRSLFLGSARCERLAALFCDGFESEAAGAGPDPGSWTQPFGYRPTIDAGRAARGQKSLHFVVPARSPGHIEHVRSVAAAQGALYGRMFVRFAALPQMPPDAHWSIVAALAGADGAEVRVGGQARNDNRFGISSRRAGDGGWDWHTAATEPAARPPTDEWVCLEWYFGVRDRSTRVWVNGNELASLRLTETEYRPGDAEGGRRWELPSFDRVRIGWWLYPITDPQPPQYELWVDEVAFDDARIGCVD